MISLSLVQNLRQQLMLRLPFSGMALEDVDLLIECSSEVYFAPNEVILSPADGPPACLYLIRQGRISEKRISPGLSDSAFELEAGELFSVSASLAAKPVAAIYVAIGDCFCLTLPAAVMQTLVDRSKPFRDFIHNSVWMLLEQSRQALRNNFASKALLEQSLETRLGDLVRRTPITTSAQTSLRDALTVMHTKRVGSMLVVSEEGLMIGILTRYDVLDRVTLAGLSLDTPIGQVMSTEVKTLTVDHTAESAAVMMSRFEIRHVPIVDLRNRVVGLIAERDLFALQRQSLGTISSLIRQADDVIGLKECAYNIRRFARNLLGQGVSARQLTFLVSHLNDVLTERLITLLAQSNDLELSSFVWMSLGSEGRSEQTIATDQDNALLYQQSDNLNEKNRYLTFAKEVNDALDVCGYPLCKGNIMASNASLCLTVDEWRTRFMHWIEHGYPEDLLKAGIFFDFRGLAGNVDLLKSLREEVTTAAARTPRFIKLLADAALANRVPLNWLGSLETKILDGKSIIDLKLQGTALVVETARIYALALGIEELNTQDRLAAIGRALGLAQTETDAWIAAFQFLQTLRLAIQIDHDPIAGNPNAIEVDSLNAVDRSILKESMARIRSLQQRLELDYVR